MQDSLILNMDTFHFNQVSLQDYNIKIMSLIVNIIMNIITLYNEELYLYLETSIPAIREVYLSHLRQHD